MQRKFVRLVTSWMLMGSMLLSGNSGMVLCVGDDGHLAVESAIHDHGGCALEEDTCAHQDIDLPGAEAGWHAMGGCDDIPLDFQIALLDAKALQINRLLVCEPINLAPAGYAVAAALDAAHDLHDARDTGILRISPSVLEKRTIVLRI